MLKNILQWFGGGNKPAGNDTVQQAEVQQPNGEILEIEAQQNLYDFREVTVDEIKKRPDAIHDMFVGKSDGFLIKNFMPEHEVDKLLEKLEAVRAKKEGLANTDVGFTYPMIFAEYNRQMSFLPEGERHQAAIDYYLQMEKFNADFASEYGVDAHAAITSFFHSIGGGRKIDQPEGIDDTGRFPFVTFRYLVPYQGLMSVHCANYFGTTFSEAYAHLNKKVIAKNQMSYFIMLQEPEAGGELSLFNFRWQPGQTKATPHEDNEIIQPDGTKMYVQTDPSIRKNKIKPKKGDMILFQGGNIWHRVERVTGNTPRITFGGFLSLSHDKETIYYWS
jgi:hypothetical protein